jgi:uncharacterized Zn finger protein
MSVYTCNRCSRGVAEFIGYQYHNIGKVKYIYRCTECGDVHSQDVDPKWDMEHPKVKGMLPTRDWLQRKRLIEGRM